MVMTYSVEVDGESTVLAVAQVQVSPTQVVIGGLIGLPHLGEALDTLVEERIATVLVVALAAAAAGVVGAQVDSSHVLGDELGLLGHVLFL